MWLLILTAWPWAPLSPLERPFEAFAAAAHFDWKGTMLFEGKHIRATNLPARYLPVWFAITLPELYAFAFAVGPLAWLARSRLRPTKLRYVCACALLSARASCSQSLP